MRARRSLCGVRRGSAQAVRARLVLRRPTVDDAPEVLRRYAGDPQVTPYLSWPTHRSMQDTVTFVGWSDAAWSDHRVGPYLICDAGGRIVGSTGLDVETPWRAATGYVLARDAWGLGYATEAAGAMVALAARLGLARLYALCHAEHRASARVLHKLGFLREGVLRRHMVLPNLDAAGPLDVECWARTR